jgi:hypothetical protein
MLEAWRITNANLKSAGNAVALQPAIDPNDSPPASETDALILDIELSAKTKKWIER